MTSSELLFCASLLKDQLSLDFFKRWQASVTLDHLPHGQFPLLALLHANLESQGIQHPWQSRLRGIYRRTWYANQLLLGELTLVTEVFQKNRIPALLTGSGALIQTVYSAVALRPIPAIELLVAVEYVDSSIGILCAMGWQSSSNLRIVQDWGSEWRTSITFYKAEGQQLELRWQVLSPHRNDEAAMWQRSQELASDSLAIRVLDPSDSLLVACFDLINSGLIGWVDIYMIVSRHEIDWHRIGSVILKSQFRHLIGHVFERLNALMGDLIPVFIVHDLKSVRKTWHDDLILSAGLSSPENRSLGQRLLLRHLRFCQRSRVLGRSKTIMHFGRYLKNASVRNPFTTVPRANFSLWSREKRGES